MNNGFELRPEEDLSRHGESRWRAELCLCSFSRSSRIRRNHSPVVMTVQPSISTILFKTLNISLLRTIFPGVSHPTSSPTPRQFLCPSFYSLFPIPHSSPH